MSRWQAWLIVVFWCVVAPVLTVASLHVAAVRPPLQGALMDPRLKAALGAAIALLYLVLRFKGLG